MSDNRGANVDATVNRVADKLEKVREASADLPESERRSAFRQTLDEELGELGGEDAEQILVSIKDRFVDEARQRETRSRELEQQTQALTAQLQAVSTERDRLREEIERLRDQSTAPAAAATSAGGDLGKVKEGLLRVSHGEEVTPESIGLPPSEARVFRLIKAMLDFALKYELGLNLLLAEFKIGPAGDADTKLIQGLQEQVRERFRACLENKEGSLQELTETLERNARFLIDLNRSYQASLYDGNQSMLNRLDPRPILEGHKRVLGSDFEGAWKTISRAQADLVNLSRAELWEQFFVGPFREKLAGYQD
jgi:hypothetical protein